MKANTVTYEITYNGKNITGDILPYVISVSYTDHADTESDEIEITLDDSDKLWQYQWYPAEGDVINLKINNIQGVLNCGVFTIDEIRGDFSEEGDIIIIKGIAAGINKKLRTIGFYAHESKTLREIANTVAAKNNLTVEGNIPDIRIARKTQYQKTDLHFLRELADSYGLTFSVRDSKLTFTDIFEIEGKEASLAFNRNEVKSVSISGKTSGTYSSVEIERHDPQKNEVVSFAGAESNPAFSGTKADTMVLRHRVENQQQAEIMSKVALYRANSLKQEGTIETEGNIYLVAGTSIELVDFGMFSGKYYVTQSTHSPNKDDGYMTTADIKRVGLVGQNNTE